MEITVLKEHQVLLLLVELFLLLLLARGLGEVFRRFGQPAVVGEILAGVLLGPTVLGNFFPAVQHRLFPTGDTIQMHMLEVFPWLGALFLLMVAGMEVDLPVVRKQGKTAIIIAVSRMVISFAGGFALGLLLPISQSADDVDRLLRAAFLGIAFGVCAVPVLAKILYDLGMLKSDIGLLTLSSSALTDFLCWTLFTVILGVAAGTGFQITAAVRTIGLTVVFVLAVLTLGRSIVNVVVRHIQDEPTWQSGSVMVFAFLLALGLAALCQGIGLHAVFGFFLAGILIGDCPYVSSQVRESITAFVLSLFSPLFFAGIGLKVDFLTGFNPLLILAVFLVLVVVNVAGALVGTRLAGMRFDDSLPVASGMLAGGAIEIIVALIGLQYRLIDEEIFVALVIVAVATSIITGPLIAWSVRIKKRFDLPSILPPQAIIADLPVVDIHGAVSGLVQRLAGHLKPYTPDEVVAAVLVRESIRTTALGNHLAVPHARLENLSRPLLAAARVKSGLPMDSPDGQDVHLVFLILTPAADMGLQVQILAGIAGALQDPQVRRDLLDAPDAEMPALLLSALRGRTFNQSLSGAVS